MARNSFRRRPALARAASARHFRPALEALEDGCVLSMITGVEASDIKIDTAGDLTATITIDGTGFPQDAKVKVNALERLVPSVESGKLVLRDVTVHPGLNGFAVSDA